MTRQVLQGVPASSGTSIGLAAVLADMETGPGQGGAEDQERALEALQRLGEDLAAQAVEARNNGHSEEADILEANRRIVEDPPLVSRVPRACSAASVRCATRVDGAVHAPARTPS